MSFGLCEETREPGEKNPREEQANSAQEGPVHPGVRTRDLPIMRQQHWTILLNCVIFLHFRQETVDAHNVCSKTFTRARVFEAASQGNAALLDGLLEYLQVKGKRLTSPEFIGKKSISHVNTYISTDFISVTLSEL